MNVYILFVILTCSSAFARLSEQEENVIFRSYLLEFKIPMRRFDDFKLRKETFIKHFYEVEEHNAINSTYSLGINEFSHLTDEELKKQKTGYVYRPFEQSTKPLPKLTNNINKNTNIDWRNNPGVVMPVQNQGSCGSCWAFAAIAALEGQSMLQNRQKQKLSEQEILDCVQHRGCNGGWDTDAYTHIRSSGGVTTAVQNPYVGFTAGRTCNLNNFRSYGSAVTSWQSTAGSEQEILRLLQYGPLFIVFHVADDFYLYRSGIYQDTRNLCYGRNINHAVLLVGAGTENGIDYWLAKNSWGVTWGERGYFRLRRNQNLCGIQTYASFPVVRKV